MSDTPITEAELQAHADGRLPPERAAIVAAWLAEHPDERARIEAYREQRDALRAALAPTMEEPLPPALDLRLRARSRRDWGASVRAASMAGLLLLGGAGGWMLRGWDAPASTGTAALAREAVANYVVYANDSTRPVEMAAGQQQALDGWLSERLARRVAAPDLGAVGLHLIGGRLVATEHGPAALYIYRDTAGARVALYLRPMTVDGTDRMREREADGVRGWTWAHDGLGFGVFGAAPQEFLHRAADLVRTQSGRT